MVYSIYIIIPEQNCVMLIVECFRPHKFSSEIVTIFCEFVRNMHRDYSVLFYYHSRFTCSGITFSPSRYNTRNSDQAA